MRHALPLALVCAVLLATPSSADDTMAAARLAYEQRADAAQAKSAWELFGKSAGADPQSYEARWEAARACYYLGTYPLASASDDEKMKLFQEGIDLAKAAVTLRPTGVEGHFWLGVLYGVYGEAKGILKSLALVPDIKKEMQACLEIDPAVEGHGPDRVLGRMFFRLPFFKGGDNEKSIEHLERSLAGSPTNALTRLYLAETYKAEGMKPKAIAQLEEIVRMTPDPLWAAEHPTIRADAEKLLKKLK
ncbi:MAG: tetratricopeptide repeat protein [Acidobacteriota bacterium]